MTRSAIRAAAIFVILGAGVAEAHHLDGSDPTQLNPSLKPSVGIQRLSGEQVTLANLAGDAVLGPLRLSAEFGYGESSATQKSDFSDLWLAVQHKFWETDSDRGLLNFGWKAEAIIPLSDFDRGVSLGYRAYTIGMIGALQFGQWRFYPEPLFVYADAEDDLEDVIVPLGLPSIRRQARMNVGFAPVIENPIYLLVVPGVSYDFASEGTQAYLAVNAGVFLTPMGALELNGQFLWDDDLDPLYGGEGNFVRMMWVQFF